MHRKSAARAVCGLLAAGLLLPSAALYVSAEPEETTAVTEQTAAETTASETTAETTSAAETTTEKTTTTTTETTTVAATTTKAQQNAAGAMKYTELPDGTVRITRFSWLDEMTVTVPSELDGKTVTEIGTRAFQYCYADEVILPATVRSIGDEAFAGDAYLLRMTIPEACTSIGTRAFAECALLNEVNVPESVSDIGADAFAETPFLSAQQGEYAVLGGGVLCAYRGSSADVTLPENVRAIAARAFAGHSELQGITLPDSLKAIGDSAFAGCAALKTVNTAAELDAVGESAFSGTPFSDDFKGEFLTLGGCLLRYAGKDTEVHVPGGTHSLGDAALAGNTAVTTLMLPDSVAHIGKAACRGCTSLQVVTLGDGVQSIGASAFEGCETLRYLRVGHHLTEIGGLAFAGCGDLEKMYLPDTLTVIGEKALGWLHETDSSEYGRLNTELTLFSNTDAAKAYAQAAGLKLEPLPEAENTEPPPEITTVSTQQFAGLSFGGPWIPAAALGGFLVLVGGITFAVRRRKKQ